MRSSTTPSSASAAAARKRTSRAPAALAALALVLGAEVAAAAGDARSRELLRRRCGSELGWEDVTLFANGTVRLRLRSGGEPGEEEPERLELVELEPGELEAFANRLAAEDLAESESIRMGSGGEYLTACELVVATGGVPRRFQYARLESLSLALGRVDAVADELVTLATARRIGSAFPAGYEPAIGDILIRADGARFEIRTFTGDGRGVEVEGLEQPLVLYVAREDVARAFAALAGRRGDGAR